ncbi:MAG: Lrp/AsnC family transcriptional regulator [Ignavibacteria bacterium]|jgi:Lrp/AsnC family leucine-responsive transcriptional regulator
MKFDEIDKKVLDTLQTNARITNAQLANDAGISPPGMLERVRRLENTGVIRKYVALINPEKVGRGTLAMVSVSLAVHQIPSIDSFTEEINKLEEVLECYHLAGEHDFLLKVAVQDIRDYENFMLTKLTKIKGVSKIKTSFILSTVKYDTKLNINSNNHK